MVSRAKVETIGARWLVDNLLSYGPQPDKFASRHVRWLFKPPGRVENPPHVDLGGCCPDSQNVIHF
jgi:hypothetical protein